MTTSGKPNGTPDPVDQAIEAERTAVRMHQFNVHLGTTGRPVVVAFPVDMTALEMLDFIAWCGNPNKALAELQKAAHPARARLLLPT